MASMLLPVDGGLSGEKKMQTAQLSLVNLVRAKPELSLEELGVNCINRQ